MNTPVLDDSALNLPGTMSLAVETMAKALRLHGQDALDAPTRFGPALPSGQLTFTVGGTREPPGVVGVRIYDLQKLNAPRRSEATLVFDSEDGSLRGIVTGRMLGAVRTGAIGGVAVNLLACPAPEKLALIGTGLQARTQLAAALTVRKPRNIQVYSRSAERLSAFIDQAQAEHSRPLEAAKSAQQAVEGADVVLTVTDSPTPVIEADWLSPGVHINQVGPSLRDAHELGLDVVQSCDLLYTDSLAQRHDARGDFFLSGSDQDDRVQELGRLVAGHTQGRTRTTGRSLFLSLGLAGTEVLLAEALLRRHGQPPPT